MQPAIVAHHLRQCSAVNRFHDVRPESRVRTLARSALSCDTPRPPHTARSEQPTSHASINFSMHSLHSSSPTSRGSSTRTIPSSHEARFAPRDPPRRRRSGTRRSVAHQLRSLARGSTHPHSHSLATHRLHRCCTWKQFMSTDRETESDYSCPTRSRCDVLRPRHTARDAHDPHTRESTLTRTHDPLAT